jgi:hypothetical protein
MGIILTASFTLKYFEKNENTRSIRSWVQKLVRTSVPRSVYETSYISWKVTKRRGGSAKTEDIVK